MAAFRITDEAIRVMLPDLFRLIGSDRYLAPEEVTRATEPHALTASAWDVYTTHFHGFTGATLDPQFHRLAHPGDADGPRQAGRRNHRRRCRDGAVAVAADPRAQRRPRPPARVHLSAWRRHAAGPRRRRGPGARRPLVRPSVRKAARSSRPTGARRGSCSRASPPESLFVPSPLPTWGFWAATAVAMAADAGASRIALVGLDDRASPRLTALLELIARLAPFTAFDCSSHGAGTRGWVPASMHEVAGAKQIWRPRDEPLAGAEPRGTCAPAARRPGGAGPDPRARARAERVNRARRRAPSPRSSRGANSHGCACCSRNRLGCRCCRGSGGSDPTSRQPAAAGTARAQRDRQSGRRIRRGGLIIVILDGSC